MNDDSHAGKFSQNFQHYPIQKHPHLASKQGLILMIVDTSH